VTVERKLKTVQVNLEGAMWEVGVGGWAKVWKGGRGEGVGKAKRVRVHRWWREGVSGR
jgi:hypothetical protein